ncbi:NAD-dependent deacylase [Ahniella affigens]|uniref:protein acetyllysine N-acetyltransferase n=1 Tax=Ahniella affigens TaxID=2021234 RepID=A0A2P1PQ03_9GAMM|nr:Sir2 family NAD-dependent protein deacetylase [Ahniella affigens]AVP96902.1 NAD-dependent deacylase [Ahniella affigens]
MSRSKIVVFTGAGVSAESGLRTFRDMGGLWREYALEEVASPEGWRRRPDVVLSFYNERRRAVLDAKPNAAHLAIAALEAKFDVQIVTQNVDDLHERAGSTQILHVHGEILKARSTVNPRLVYPLSKPTIDLGDHCELGSQLRPHIVWFGESVQHLDVAAALFAAADKVLVIGTSLSVYPAAGLVHHAGDHAEKVLVAPEVDTLPPGYRFRCGTAVSVVPELVAEWFAKT